MKKKALLISIFSMFVLFFMGVSSLKAFAKEGYVVDVDTREVVDEITTYRITSGDESDLKKIKEFYISANANEKERIVPIKFDQKGLLVYSTYFSAKLSKTASGYFGIYTDKECTKPALELNDYTVIIPKAGMYYLLFYVVDDSTIESDEYSFDFKSQFYNGENQVLKNKKMVCSALIDESKPIYYKIPVSKTGSLTIETIQEYSANITLLDKNKKAISEKCYVPAGKNNTCFAVTKGTYYIKVTSTSNYIYVQSTWKAITDSSGGSKAKAKKLVMGKENIGIVTTNDKKGKVDWYKVTITKPQQINVMFTGNVSSGAIEIKFYGNGLSGSVTDTITTVNEDSSFSVHMGNNKDLPQGTYYIKVTKKTANTSGLYYLRVDKYK